MLICGDGFKTKLGTSTYFVKKRLKRKFMVTVSKQNLGLAPNL